MCVELYNIYYITVTYITNVLYRFNYFCISIELILTIAEIIQVWSHSCRCSPSVNQLISNIFSLSLVIQW